MATPLSSDIVALLSSDIQSLTPIQIYQLATQKLVEPNEAGDGLQISSKATRALKRASKAAELETVKVKVFDALKEIGKSTDHMFRLDDVLKATGLPKAEYRTLILDSLRSFREEGLTESVKLSDNNFQIFWKVTPEFLQD
jgi:DNA polymerase III psi subunit